MGKKLEYTGKDINEAVNKACHGMNVPREKLDIEVLSTGSTGIFGLCRQKTKILVSIKEEELSSQEDGNVSASSGKAPNTADASPSVPPAENLSPATAKGAPHEKKGGERSEPVPEAILDQIKSDLHHLLDLMGFSSEINVFQDDNHKVTADISGEHIDNIIGSGGKTLDGIQYLLRKIISKKFPQKIRFSLDAGEYRAKRMQELEDTARKLATEVKETGKTKVIQSLNPAERRVVHMILHDDTAIRSRSVGEGLFKKVLIYLPGKGKKKGAAKNKPPRDSADLET